MVDETRDVFTGYGTRGYEMRGKQSGAKARVVPCRIHKNHNSTLTRLAKMKPQRRFIEQLKHSALYDPAAVVLVQREPLLNSARFSDNRGHFARNEPP